MLVFKDGRAITCWYIHGSNRHKNVDAHLLHGSVNKDGNKDFYTELLDLDTV